MQGYHKGAAGRLPWNPSSITGNFRDGKLQSDTATLRGSCCVLPVARSVSRGEGATGDGWLHLYSHRM